MIGLDADHIVYTAVRSSGVERGRHSDKGAVMKRAIFKRQSIDVCIEGRVLATPISPETLAFAPGEEMIVATPKVEAAAGEYQFLFVVGEYLGADAAHAERLFGRASWKHLYEIDSITTIRPFSLAQVVAAAGPKGADVEYRYKGQTQHHRIIRTIEPGDEALWRAFLEIESEPATSAAAAVERNAAEAAVQLARSLADDEIVKRLLRRSKQNVKLGSGRAYRSSKSQRRSRDFSALVKLLYNGHCQVCGAAITDLVGDRTAAEVHHLEPWDGDRSDRLDNVICVCPNDHARFELGLLTWSAVGLSRWDGTLWAVAPLVLDRHLLVLLKPTPAAAVHAGTA